MLHLKSIGHCGHWHASVYDSPNHEAYGWPDLSLQILMYEGARPEIIKVYELLTQMGAGLYTETGALKS